ncbi:hypothetical protein VC83_06465 [Pseudogymnoascus destructans]|uniref:DUF1776-domain-containing protein n=2 Tax=Pseudogymnoascus destructans TaxID=655981 RepID=L8FRF1_PSED2|nr:uncharacterized protein VC83_06465 [Pseudogymnoascus destructans]ELR02286.1 hypothetical protein GMDG_05355 [Pseudogymnoascus destructans 20631-21]OAF58226.1 hypothetical protein VC83_06465 [Pseudogymnoascus destructans]
MSADDQAFLDALNSVPRHVQRYSNDIANYVEDHVDRVARKLRDTLASADWIPESARPRPVARAPEPSSVTALPGGVYARVQAWVLKNKVFTTAIVAGIGASAYMVQRRKANYNKKRRAKRGTNGARLEVVVISGSMNEPLVRSLALDLERRGFIVFIVCDDVQEELRVQNEGRGDIRPLVINVSTSKLGHDGIERFAQFLQTPQHAFDTARAHYLQFTALIVIPTLTYPNSPVATLSPIDIQDVINTRLLHPILLTQAFLPLLSAPTSQHHHAHPPPQPKLLLLTPVIISSLNPPFHAPESIVSAGLKSFTATLSAELSPLNVPLIHFKLGSFDTNPMVPKNQLATLSGHSAEARTWSDDAREAYGGNFMRVAGSAVEKRSKGSNLRELHNAVFDEMAKTGWRAGGTVMVGRGARLYSFVGAWAPRGLVGWMMGVRRVERPASGVSVSSTGGSNVDLEAGHSEGEYVSVQPGDDKEKR